VITIKRNQQKKTKTNSECYNKEIHGKMPVFSCSCGAKILIIPDLPEMNKAIKNHIIEHRKLSGQVLAEDDLTHKILKVIIDNINET
jgi:hypothetical protein